MSASERACPVCGGSMDGQRARAISCSDKCRGRRNRAMHGDVGRAATSFATAKARGAHVDPEFSVTDLKRMIQERGSCYLCGSSLEREYHIDHLDPIARGGAHRADNVGFLCPPCNIGKGDRTPAEYVAQLRDFESPRIRRVLARASAAGAVA